MKRLLPLMLLAACGQPVTPPASNAPPPEAAAPAPSTQTPAPAPEASAPAPAPAPAANSPEEAQQIARDYLAAQYPGASVEMGTPGAMEGAAGSIYIEIPATVTTADRTLSGTVVLRRVNDVPGSTAEQRRWHVERADLK